MLEIAHQVAAFLDQSPVGRVFPELDINLRAALAREVVYRPDIVYVSNERAGIIQTQVIGAPDVLAENTARDSRKYGSVTKRHA